MTNEKSPTKEIYAVEWCSCVYESGYSVVTLHSTKKAAVKAMVKLANERWLEDQSFLKKGIFKHHFKPLENQRWRVTSIPLEDELIEEATNSEDLSSLDEFDWHEALDRTSMFVKILDTELAYSKAVLADATIKAKIDGAVELLCEAYQLIGEKRFALFPGPSDKSPLKG